MTQFILKTFLKGGDPADPALRGRCGLIASLTGIFCNVLLFLGKLAAGFLSGSIAIMADAVNNLSDASASIVSLVGFKLAALSPDQDHPFGHARYEYLAALTVAAMVVAIGISLGIESVHKILRPEETAFSMTALGILIASILLKLWMAAFNRKVGTLINSDTLIATAVDSRNDVISTSAVLASMLICHFTGMAVFDGIFGLAVAAFIIYSGATLVRETLSPLLGEKPDPELVHSLERFVMSYPGVLGIHDLMVHDYGPGHQFASLHAEMPAERNPLESHDLIDNIEMDCWKKTGIQLVIHYDPIVTSDPLVARLRGLLHDRLKEIHPQMTLHDLRIVPGKTHTNVIFDLVMPYDYKGEEEALVEQVGGILRQENPGYFAKVKVERSYAG